MAERLVDRALMDREMQVSRFPALAPREADALLAQHRGVLARGGIQESELRDYLLAQLAVLRFIDFRFRPSVQVRESEIREYYEKRFLAESRAKRVKPDPTLESVHDSLEKILTEEKVDQVLDNWIKDTRGRTRIIFHEKAFQ